MTMDRLVVEFTKTELDVLDAMFEVLYMNGQYAVLRDPTIIKLHEELFTKFRSARITLETLNDRT